MSPRRGAPPRGVPTLTEVVEWPKRPAVEVPAADDDANPAEQGGAALDPMPEAVARAAPASAEAAEAPIEVPVLDVPLELEAAPAEPVAVERRRLERRQADRRAGSGEGGGWSRRGTDSAFGALASADDPLVIRVLAEVEAQVELMLEVRLREVLAPIVARAGDALVRDARQQLAQTLREVVERAVASERARH